METNIFGGIFMEMENLKKWLELAQQYQSDNFWKQIFEDKEKNAITTAVNPFSSLEEYFPKCDLYETDGNLIAEIEIPGITKEDVHIAASTQSLTVTGEFKSLVPNRKYFLKERANRKFKKELTLPFPVLIESIFSEIINGILVIYMPLSLDETEDIPIFVNRENS